MNNTELTDDEIDHVLAQTLDEIAAAKGDTWNCVSTDIAAHHTLRRKFARAIRAAKGAATEHASEDRLRIWHIANAWNNLDPEHKVAIAYSDLFDTIDDAVAQRRTDIPADALQARSPVESWLLELMTEHGFAIPTPAYNELVVALSSAQPSDSPSDLVDQVVPTVEGVQAPPSSPSNLIRCVQVKHVDGGWLVCLPQELTNFIDGDDQYEIIELMLTQDIFDSLPEFEGF